MAFSIGEAAAKVGLSASALRYYEAAGLLQPSDRRSGRRLYDAEALAQARFIASAREVGLSINDVRQLIALVKGVAPGSEKCYSARAFVAGKVVELDRQIAKATALRDQLSGALENNCDRKSRCSVS